MHRLFSLECLEFTILVEEKAFVNKQNLKFK